jgi:hypothetical protein
MPEELAKFQQESHSNAQRGSYSKHLGKFRAFTLVKRKAEQIWLRRLRILNEFKSLCFSSIILAIKRVCPCRWPFGQNLLILLCGEAIWRRSPQLKNQSPFAEA